MNVAIFTDNDFDKVNGVTTTLRAVLRHAPPGIRPRVYTAARHAVDQPDYLALRSLGVPHPVLRRDADVPAARARVPRGARAPTASTSCT